MTRPIMLVLPTLGRGGAERVFVDLAGGLAARGREVHLVWASGDGQLADGIDASVTTHDLGRSRTAQAIPVLRRLIGEVDPGAVLSALFHGNMLAAAGTRGRRRRPALVFTEHIEIGTLPETAPKRLTRWSPRLIPVAYRMADAVVAVSTGVARDLRTVGHLPPALIHHIPNPVDLDRVRSAALAAPVHPWLADEELGRPVLVAAGRLSAVKGFDVLIEAMVGIDENVRLVILGEGPERERLAQQITDNGLEKRVDLFGSVENPYADMARADLVVSSSRTEALPTVLIEALHLGKPVVASDCSLGVREVLDGGARGRLVPVGDPMALAVAVRAAMDEPTSVRADAMATYSMSSVSERYEFLIDAIERD